MQNVRQRAYDFLFEAPEDDRAANAFQTFIMALIALNVCTSILETEPTVRDLAPCLLYTSPSPRDGLLSRMPSSA